MTKARDLASNAEGTKPKVIDAAGDLIYGTGSDAASRLAIGTAGQVLQVNSGATAPEWITLAGGGSDFTLINTGGTALTGASTITVSGISGKDKLFIWVDVASAGAGAIFTIRFNGDTGSNYGYWGQEFIANAQFSSNFNDGATAIPIGRTFTNNGDGTVEGVLLIEGCNSTGLKVGTASSASANGSNNKSWNHSCYYKGTSAITSVSIISDTGDFDFGTIYVYGA